MNSSNKPNIIIVGAGVSGLSAARALRARGVPVTLIEALPYIGGRARTTQLANEPFDLGATWLHDADRNPLVALARPSDDLTDTDAARRERTTIDGRPIDRDEQAALDLAWHRLDHLATHDEPDTTLAALIAAMAGEHWAPLLSLWEGPTIAAADASRLGAHDWRRNRLDGRNLVPRNGVGTFIATRLATGAHLSTPAKRIVWDGPGVTVETPSGTIRGSTAIITVSTGVLAAGTISFDPPLPGPVQAAIHALPMGLLTKIALPACTRLGLQSDTTLVDRSGRMTFNAFPLGRAHIAGFVGGDQAWSLATDPAALEAFARQELARTLGHAALSDVLPAATVTDWGTNPAFRGAYAYAGPGDANQRGVLGTAFPGERLVFAGEATRTDGLAGTVAGAYLSGIEAAERIMSAATGGRGR